MSQPDSPSSGSHRRLEIAGIIVFALLTCGSVWRLAVAWPATADGAGWVVAGGLLAGWLFADFSSGFVHWAADNWGEEHWPLVGPGFVAPFRYHHVDPKDIARHDFVETNGNNCIISLWTFYWPITLPAVPSSWSLFLAVFWLTVALAVLATNQFHAWAHADHVPKWVRVLQQLRLILPPDHHDLHHRAPHDRNYCITCGWLNEPLRLLRFFETVEWCMTAVTGHLPLHSKSGQGGPREP